MKTLLLFIVTIGISTSLFSQKQKVIFDCDLGGDIDDAFALALLLSSHEELDILGICMDHGDTEGRARIANKILYETGFDNIPVYVGRHTVNVAGEDTVPAGPSPQYIWAENFNRKISELTPAADLIVKTLNRYPGEVILFTVGPVDNIEDVLKKDPNALQKAKRVISMFGSVEKGYGGSDEISAEWNVRANIPASQMLMNSGANLLLAPLDITAHVVLSDKYLSGITMRKTPLTDAVSSLYSLWYHQANWANQPVMFDGVAVGMLLWPELFETRKAYIYVDEEGYTREDKTKEPNCQIGVKIKDEEFLLRMYRKLIEQGYKR